MAQSLNLRIVKLNCAVAQPGSTVLGRTAPLQRSKQVKESLFPAPRREYWDYGAALMHATITTTTSTTTTTTTLDGVCVCGWGWLAGGMAAWPRTYYNDACCVACVEYCLSRQVDKACTTRCQSQSHTHQAAAQQACGICCGPKKERSATMHSTQGYARVEM